jgi:hypothetical protein
MERLLTFHWSLLMIFLKLDLYLAMIKCHGVPVAQRIRVQKLSLPSDLIILPYAHEFSFLFL